MRSPWARRWDGAVGALPDRFAWMERVSAFGVAAVVAAFAFAYFSADAVRAWAQLSAAEGALRSGESAFLSASSDREAALALIQRNQPLAIAATRGSPLGLMAGVAAALPDDGVRLIDWFQQNSDLNASMIVNRPLDGAALVRRLEAIPNVATVTLDGAGGSEERVVRLRLTFTP